MVFAVELIYQDRDVLVCIKPAGVCSTDVPGGVPELAREALGKPKADVRTVHRLDQVVSGVMVLACSRAAASELSRQVREDRFRKSYLAVVHGAPEYASGTYEDLLLRNKTERKTYVVDEPGKDVQHAILDYRVINRGENMSRVAIALRTGRTHQIRAQFSSRGMPLVGDRKYGTAEDACPIALWSHTVGFVHPGTGQYMEFTREPPDIFPWTDV